MDFRLWALLFAFLAWWGYLENRQHVACIQSGGSPVLGWFLDGCEDRKEGA